MSAEVPGSSGVAGIGTITESLRAAVPVRPYDGNESRGGWMMRRVSRARRHRGSASSKSHGQQNNSSSMQAKNEAHNRESAKK
jgi:hypothetical protein